jgi:hypothetical protein
MRFFCRRYPNQGSAGAGEGISPVFGALHPSASRAMSCYRPSVTALKGLCRGYPRQCYRNAQSPWKTGLTGCSQAAATACEARLARRSFFIEGLINFGMGFA